jgi:hypothetical protein
VLEESDWDLSASGEEFTRCEYGTYGSLVTDVDSADLDVTNGNLGGDVQLDGFGFGAAPGALHLP